MRLHVRRSKAKQKRVGFRARMKTKKGRQIVARRRRLHGTFP
jgi:ribosomal protein L34